MVDLLLEHGTVVTVDEERTILDDGAVAVDEGAIVGVGPVEDVRDRFDADAVIDAAGHAVVPGLISTHAHISDVLLRGGPNTNRDVYDWLYNVKVPGVSAMEPSEHATAAALYCQEAIQSGITTVVENAIGRGAGFPEEVVEAKLETYDASGMRNVYAQAFSDVPPDEAVETFLERIQLKEPAVEHVSPAWVETEEAIEGIESLIESYHGSAGGRQSIWPAPYLTWGVTPDGFTRARELARRYDVMTTTHVAETAFQERNAISSVEHLSNVGYLGERTLLGHCVHVDERDVRLLAQTGTKVAHNVLTNLALGDGIAPVPTMRSHGVTVGLGTDNTSASDTINAINDLRYAALVHKGHRGDAGAMTADAALEMATIDAARAIGRADDLGSIEEGKRADLVVVDLEHPHLTPSFDVVSTLVYQAQGFEVETVICDGSVIMDDRRVSGIERDHPTLREDAQATAEAVFERIGFDEPRRR